MSRTGSSCVRRCAEHWGLKPGTPELARGGQRISRWLMIGGYAVALIVTVFGIAALVVG
jgi:hypothetical protein